MWEDVKTRVLDFASWLWNQAVQQLDLNQVIGNILGNALGALLVAVVFAAFVFFGGRSLLTWLKGRAKVRLESRRIKPGSAEHYTILVARLAGDADGSQQRHIIQSLDRQLSADRAGSAIAVRAYPDQLVISELADRAKARADVEAKGRRWLSSKSADLLVWGEVGMADRVLRLRFLSAAEPDDADTKGYALTDTLELPADFGEDLGAVLEGLVAASIAPAYESGRFTADILEPSFKRLRRLAGAVPAGLSAESRAALHHSHAITAFRLGEQRGDNALLAEAVAAYREALTEWTRERVPLDWAMTQTNLGNALLRLGAHESGSARLEEAVAAYREALTERTRERVPLDWAATQNNLGGALRTLGERESGTAGLKEAVTAYSEALEEFTPAAHAEGHKTASNGLEDALALLKARQQEV